MSLKSTNEQLEKVRMELEKRLFETYSQGMVAERVVTSMGEKGKPTDFVLCIGDDRSDEDMFEIVESAVSRGILSPDALLLACTVGQKPSKARYFVSDTSEVRLVLESLAEFSDLSNSAV